MSAALFRGALCAAAVVIFASVAGAQIISSTRYSIREGLPSNNINVIYQDSRGVMWFGTTEGLSSFDGQSFRNYGLREGLPQSSVMDVFEDNRTPGTMWLLAGRHVCRLQDGRCRVFALQTPYVRSIHQDREGVVWCAAGRGVLRIDGERIREFRPPQLDAAVIQIAEVGDSLLWFALEGGISAYSRGTRSWTRIDLRAWGNGLIWSMLADRFGNLWVSLDNNYLVRVRGTSIVASRRMPNSAAFLCDDPRGYLWCGGYDGIARIDLHHPGIGAPKFYSADNGLTENTVRCLHVDRENDLWVGGRDQGIQKFPPSELVRFPLAEVQSYSLSHNLRYACSDTNGHVWVATTKEVREYWRDAGGAWHSHPALEFREFHYTAIFFDRANNFWMMDTHANGIWRLIRYRVQFQPGEGWSRLSSPSVMPDWPKIGFPVTFIVDRKGTVWQAGGGIFRIESGGGGRVRTSHYGKDAGIPTEYVRELFEDHAGNIWTGSLADGIVELESPHSGEMRIQKYNGGNGFPDNGIWSIREDRRGDVLVGTAQSGLAIIREGRVRTLTTREGLPSNTIRCTTEDSSGRLWIGTSIGMSFEEPPGSRNFRKKDNFLGTEVYCCGTTRDGLVWYTTPSNLWVFDPGEERRRIPPPSLFVTGVGINGMPQAVRDDFVLSYNENNIDISFIAISFEDEKAIRYMYRLNGAETEWHGPTSTNRITYGHLAPGSYLFEVRATNWNGVPSARTASIHIRIAAPYWQHWWFRICVALLLVGGTAFLYQRRIKKIRALEKSAEDFSRRLISEQEAERKRIAHELHDGLGQEFIVISNRARRGMKEPDEEGMRGQLDRIAQSAARALESVREIALDLSPYHLEHLGLATAVRSMANRLAESSSIPVALRIGEIDAAVESMSRIHVYRIVQEALTNVLKHSEATRAELEMEADAEGLRIAVTDNGKGFTPGEQGRSSPAGGGMGLPGMLERVRIIGGRLTIESAPGSGTKIRITIPPAPDRPGREITARKDTPS